MTGLDLVLKKVSSVVSVSEEDDISAVVAKLTLHNIGAVIVLGENGQLSGIITEADVTHALFRRREMFFQLVAKDLMCSRVISCTVYDSTADILATMTANNVSYVAVIMGTQVVGVVSLMEAVKARLASVSRLAKQAAEQVDDVRRVQLLDQHLCDSRSIHSLVKSIADGESECGIGGLEHRARQLFWFIGERERLGNHVKISDLLKDHVFGTFPTVRRQVAELEKMNLVDLRNSDVDQRIKFVTLTDYGREIFDRVTRRVLTGSPAAVTSSAILEAS